MMMQRESGSSETLILNSDFELALLNKAPSSSPDNSTFQERTLQIFCASEKLQNSN
jgi:hypothetical protein